MLMASMVGVDLRARSLLMDAASDIAFKRLRVLHIRLNLAEHRVRPDVPKKQESGSRKRGSTHADLF
jgi:hypothetical protein